MKRWILSKLKPWVAQRLEWLLLWYFSITAKHRRCKEYTNQILIVRTDGLGDYILWLDAQKQIRSMFPDKKIVMMFDAEKPTLDLAKYNVDIDEAFNVHIHGYKRFIEIFRMRTHKYALIIQPIYGRTAFSDLLVFACHADRRITLEGNRRFLTKWEKKITDKAYDEIIPASASVQHELIRCGELIRGLGKNTYYAGLPQLPQLPIELPELISSYGVIYPGGSWKEKCWAPKNFATVCDWLIESQEIELLFCGGSNDIAAAQEIQTNMKNKDKVKIVAGKHTICQSVEIIRHALFVFGNDTGAIHIAAACKVPAVAIVVGREIGRFFPYQTEDNKPVAQQYFPVPVFADMPCLGCLLEEDRMCSVQNKDQSRLPCIQQISVKQVCNALQRILGNIS